MLHGTPSPGVAGSELTRLLARLADPPPAAARPDVAERLGHWLGWTGASALSAVLNGAAPTPGPQPADSRAAVRARAVAVPAPAFAAEEADFQRVHAGLAAAIAAGPDEPASSPTDFGPYRRHCSARQHAMQEAVGGLRRRLREVLTRRSPALARLAAIDALLDATLAAHERTLLALVSLRLQAHFERLQQNASATPDSPDSPGSGSAEPAAAPWLASFRADLDRVLHAELAHRLLPARGLLDALRTSAST